MIRIKNDFMVEEQISVAAFNEADKEIIIYLKNGMMVIYGPTQKIGMIPRQRVISDGDYSKIKDYFAIDMKAKMII